MYGVQYGREYSGTEATLGQQFTKTLTDAVNVASNLVRQTGKLLTSAINTTSTIVRSVAKQINDSFVIATFSLDTFKAMGLTLVDSVIATSSLIKTIGKNVLTDTVNASSLLSKSVYRLLSDLITTVDTTIETTVQKVLNFLELISLNESFIKNIGKTLSDALNTSEVFAKIHIFYRTFTDALVTIDSILRQRLMTFLDSIRVSESFIMRLNGLLQNWRTKIRTAVDWTNKVRGTGDWSLKTRVTSLWTEKPRQE